MCLAIFKPADVAVPLESLRNGWIGNSDGAGYAFAYKGKIIQRKGFTSLKDFLGEYEEDAKKYLKGPGVVHFRIRSMGDKSTSNMHPFPILDGEGVMIHNGNLSGTGALYGVGDSDTKKFAEAFNKDLTFDFCETNKVGLGNAVGWDKLVFLWKDGRHVIINEEKGYWEGGVWYSNKTYTSRPCGAVQPYHGMGMNTGGMYDD